MSEKRYFVVRESGEYECEIPETMTLREAIRLYKSGVRVKAPPSPVADRKVIADVPREKREGRARAKVSR